jgi:Flp pilus assembly protein TadG
MFGRILSRTKSERGQSFVELAISIVFLLILLSGLIDFGWAFYTQIALRDAAEEAALYGSMCPNDESLIEDRLIASTDSPLDMADVIAAGEYDICVIDDPGNPPASCADAPAKVAENGDGMRIEITVQHTVLTPFVATFIGRTSYPLSVDVTNVIMRDDPDDEDCFY